MCASDENASCLQLVWRDAHQREMGVGLSGEVEVTKENAGTYRERLFVVDVIILYSMYLLPSSNFALLPFCFLFCSALAVT